MTGPIAQQTSGSNYVQRGGSSSSLADVVDLILEKGLVIDIYARVSLVGIEILTVDVRIVVASVDTYLRFAEAVNRLDIAHDGTLLTIKLRLLVASVDRAKEMGIDWWEHDPSLSSKARAPDAQAEAGAGGDRALQEENRRLRERLAALEAGDGAAGAGAGAAGKAGDAPAARTGRGKEPRT